MAFKSKYPAYKVTTPGLIDVVGKVLLTTAAAISTLTGKGCTPTKTGTGLYTLTLACGKTQSIVHASVYLVDTDGELYPVKILTQNATTGVVTIAVMDEDDTSGIAAAADPASGAYICWRIAVQESSSTR